MSLKAPFLLGALPAMDDPEFFQTIVLVTQHDSEGSFGFVLNRPLRDEEDAVAMMRAEIRDTSGNMVAEFEETLFEGGPTDDESLYLVHGSEALGDPAKPIGNGLFVSTAPESFQAVLENRKNKVPAKFFVGAAGWHFGQLESEIRSGVWYPMPLDAGVVFKFPEESQDPSEWVQWQQQVWASTLRSNGCDPVFLQSSGGSGELN